MSFRRLLTDRRVTAAFVALAAGLSAVAASAVASTTASGSKSATHHAHRDRERVGQHRGRESYTIGLFGDTPYGALGRSQYPNLLADINQSHVAFSIFDGDLQAGGDGPCNDSRYTTSLANFDKLERPLVWVPGDNDWTDCWGRYGVAQAPYHDPIERLNFERKLFDSSNQSLG